MVAIFTLNWKDVTGFNDNWGKNLIAIAIFAGANTIGYYLWDIVRSAYKRIKGEMKTKVVWQNHPSRQTEKTDTSCNLIYPHFYV